MKIVVIGGTGLIGSKVVRTCEKGPRGHRGGAQHGVNTITGEGLAEALAGAQSSSTSRTRPRLRTKPC